MKSFADAQGQSWTFDINVASLRRVKDATDIDLTKLVDRKADVFPRLAGDLFILYDVVTVLLKPQLEERQLTAEQFGALLDEDVAERAVTALVEAIIDFFQEGKRMLLRRAFAKVTQAADHRRTTTLNAAMRQVESPQFDELLEKTLANPSTPGS